MGRKTNRALAFILAMLIPLGVKAQSKTYKVPSDYLSSFPDVSEKIDVSKMLDEEVIPLDFPNFFNNDFEDPKHYEINVPVDKYLYMGYYILKINGKDTLLLCSGNYEDLKSSHSYFDDFSNKYPGFRDQESATVEEIHDYVNYEYIGLFPRQLYCRNCRTRVSSRLFFKTFY